MFLVEIEKIVQGGFGLGRIEGKVIFIPYTIPGETVRVEKTIPKKDYELAHTYKILRPSPNRIPPLCPYFPLCGGCQFQHMAYDTERAIKEEMFKETLRRMTGISGVTVNLVHSSPMAYRNRVRFHSMKGHLGFKTAKATRVVPIDRCIVCVEEVNRFLEDIRNERVQMGSRGEVTVFGYGGNYFWKEGIREVTVELLGKQVSFPIESFFQSNVTLLEHLIRSHILPLQASRILELYGGVGTFGVFLTEHCSHYTMVEEYPLSVEYARKNLGGRGVKVVQARVERWIPQAGSFDTVVLDPPRNGLSAPVREFLKRKAPRKILYISCNPVTFARDLKSFLSEGYKFDSITLYDFYPRTTHLEVVCQLERR